MKWGGEERSDGDGTLGTVTDGRPEREGSKVGGEGARLEEEGAMDEAWKAKTLVCGVMEVVDSLLFEVPIGGLQQQGQKPDQLIHRWAWLSPRC